MIWGKTKINLLDAPGYFDFVGEVEEAVSAADGAVIVVNGKSGVDVGAQKAWNICEEKGLPRSIYVSNMDFEHADYNALIETLKDLYGTKIAPIQLPIRENDKLVGYVDVVEQKAYRYADKQNKKECDVPGDLSADMETFRESIMEAVAETSEEFMDRYFGGDEFTNEEIESALKQSIHEGSIVPVTVGSSISLQGVGDLMDAIVSFCPNPAECKISGKNTKTGDAFEANYDSSKE